MSNLAYKYEGYHNIEVIDVRRVRNRKVSLFRKLSAYTVMYAGYILSLVAMVYFVINVAIPQINAEAEFMELNGIVEENSGYAVAGLFIIAGFFACYWARRLAVKIYNGGRRVC